MLVESSNPRSLRLLYPALAALFFAGCADGELATAPMAPDQPSFDFTIQSHPVNPTITSNAFEGERDATEGRFTAPISELPGGVMNGEVVHVGGGCVGDAYLADPAGKIALILRGVCRFDEKIARAQIAGATGVVVYGQDESLVVMGGDNPVTVGALAGTEITIPAVFVQNSTGTLLRDGTPPVTILVTLPPPPTPAQLLDHVYEGVDLVVSLGMLDGNLAKSLYAQLNAARRHLERGNLKGAENVLNAFINHVNSLEAEGSITPEAAQHLRNLAMAVLNAL
jgi:hypothetical protein